MNARHSRRFLTAFARALASLSIGLSLLGGGNVAAQTEPPADAQQQQEKGERERIVAERRAIELRFADEQKKCYRRFAVNACVRESRARRRSAMSVLRKQEVALNDAERVRKAELQRQKIEDRQRERARRDAGASPGEQGAPAARATAPRASASPRPAEARAQLKAPLAPRRKTDTGSAASRRTDAAARHAERAAQAQAGAARQEERVREAAEHKEKVLRENAARKKSAAPLPTEPAGR